MPPEGFEAAAMPCDTEAACCNRSTQITRPGWRNWQTQRTQNPPEATPWGFDSPSRHQDKFQKMNKLQRQSLSVMKGFSCSKGDGATFGATLFLIC